MLSRVLKFTFLVVLLAVCCNWMIKTKLNENVSSEDFTHSPKTSKASLLIKKHSEMYGKAHVIKVRDDVYVAVGYALANMIMIEGSDGIIIIDTTESEKVCLNVYKEFRKITSKPLKAIIITHFHADHMLGAAALLDEVHGSSESVEIFMHSTTAYELKRFRTSFEVGFTRAGRQFGVMLSRDHLDSGIGPSLDFGPDSDYRIVKATKTFDTEETFEVAGVNFTLMHTPGETADQITIWIPEWKLAMTADNIYEAFPNLYAIRGSPPRDCDVWYQSLDAVRRLRPEYVVPSHGKPLVGEEYIFDTLSHYRDAIQYVHDQTIRLMNKGLDIDEIVETVQLPPVLANHPFLQEFYGKVSWSVRSVFSGQLGWFSGNPVHLNPLSDKKKANKLVELLSSDYASDKEKSGLEKIIAAAENTIEKVLSEFNSTGILLDDEAQWALELSTNALKASEDNTAMHFKAKQVTIRCLKLMAISTMNSNARNYYMTYAKELETGLKVVVSEIGKFKAIQRIDLADIMSQLPFRFKAESCDDKEILTLVFRFPDIDGSFAYILRHCVLEYIDNPLFIPQEFDAELTVSSSVWRDIITKKRSPITAYATGDIILQGSMFSFKRFMDKIDRE